MSYDKFLYEDLAAINHTILGCFPDKIVGRKYNSDATVIDWRMSDDDHIDLLMVEENEEDVQDMPFVAVRLHLDVLDLRETLWREDTIRYALIHWEEES